MQDIIDSYGNEMCGTCPQSSVADRDTLICPVDLERGVI